MPPMWQRDERRPGGTCRGVRGKRRDRPAAMSTARSHVRACVCVYARPRTYTYVRVYVALCRISRMRTGLYRKGVYTRAPAYSSPFPSAGPPAKPGISTADRLAPQGPRTNNCRPVNSRYDTLEEVGERARYTYSSGGGNWRSSRLPRYKNEIRRVAPSLLSPRSPRIVSPRLASLRPVAPRREQKTSPARKNRPLRYFTPATPACNRGSARVLFLRPSLFALTY